MNTLKENVPLINYNTFKVAANARYFIEIDNTAYLQEFLNSGLVKQHRVFVLGGGSNVLFVKDFDGIIIHPVIRGIEKTGENDVTVSIKAGAGECWDDLVAWCTDRDLAGIENLSLIPGSVGASPVQNIGAYGVEVMDCIERVEACMIEDGKKISLTADECHFAYRNSIFKNRLKDKVIITHVYLKLHKTHCFNTGYPDLVKEIAEFDKVTIQNIRKAIIKIRKNKLPDTTDTGNAGSFFKNPVVSLEKEAELQKSYPGIPVYKLPDGTIKLSAAWLIDQAGWKGKAIGNAGTHIKQPLIIVNRGNASGEEIFQFATEIQNSVMEKFEVKLEVEVNII